MVYLMENGMRTSKEKEVIVDIEIDESHEAQVNRETISGNKRGKRSLEKPASEVLSYNGSGNGEANTRSDDISGGLIESPPSELKLLIDKNLQEQQRLIEKGRDKERRKAGKVKKAAKPPRPPNSPSLNAADIMLIDEITRIAMKKRDRLERKKALKKKQAARGSSSSSASLSSSNGSAIFAMAITILFILVIIFQGSGSNGSSGLSPTAAPQPAPEMTAGMLPVLSDDGAAQSFIPSKSREEIGSMTRNENI